MHLGHLERMACEEWAVKHLPSALQREALQIAQHLIAWDDLPEQRSKVSKKLRVQHVAFQATREHQKALALRARSCQQLFGPCQRLPRLAPPQPVR